MRERPLWSGQPLIAQWLTRTPHLLREIAPRGRAEHKHWAVTVALGVLDETGAVSYGYGCHGSTVKGNPELGAWLRQQREARYWSRVEMARRMTKMTSGHDDTPLPCTDHLAHNIYRWEHGGRAADPDPGAVPGRAGRPGRRHPVGQDAGGTTSMEHCRGQ